MESHINFHQMSIDDRILKVGIIHLTNIIFSVYFIDGFVLNLFQTYKSDFILTHYFTTGNCEPRMDRTHTGSRTWYPSPVGRQGYVGEGKNWIWKNCSVCYTSNSKNIRIQRCKKMIYCQ